MERRELVLRMMAATVTDSIYLRGLRQLWDPSLVGPGWLWLAEECFKWLEEKGEAPGSNIELLWAAAPLDDEVREDLAGVLERVSDLLQGEAAMPDTDTLLKMTSDYLELETILKRTIEVEAAAEANNLEQARELWETMKPKRIVEITAINPAKCREALAEAFQARSDSLVRLGGAFQEMIGELIVPDSFIVLLGGEKVGKTWLLQAIEFGAIKAGVNVLTFQCGDLSRSQKLARMSIQLTGRNIRGKYCGAQLAPVLDCRLNQANECTKPEREMNEGIVEEDSKPYPKLMSFGKVGEWWKPCTACRDFRPTTWWEQIPPCPQLTLDEAFAVWGKYDRAHPNRFMLETYQNDTATVGQMDEVQTRLWEYRGWKAGLVVVDYPDICAPEPGSGREYRHQENAKWKALRRFSQKWQCAVVAVTQANQEGQQSRLLKPKHFGEDKRKKAHPTDGFGINQDEHDKRKGWWRMNPLISRDDEFDIKDQVVVYHCLQRGMPNLGSFWLRRNER